jgi:hypothetical protein
MTVDDQTRRAIPIAQQRRRTRRGLREIGRRALVRMAPPYARRRTREAETAASLARLEADFGHVSKRHGEQIERLEELVRELVLTAESLRREIARGEAAAEPPPRRETARDRGVER